MLIREVTSAKDQLNLLKRIIDSTWTAISAEAAAEEVAKQQRAASTPKAPKPARPKTPALKPAIKKDPATPSKKPAKAPTNMPAALAPNTSNRTATLPGVVPLRRVYPAPTVKPVQKQTAMPLARLGRVGIQPQNQ